MAAPVGRPIGTSEGVQRGWPLPLRLIVLGALVGATALWLTSTGGDGGDGAGEPTPGSVPATLGESEGGGELRRPEGDDGGEPDESDEGDGGVAPADAGDSAQPRATVVAPDPGPLARLIDGVERCDGSASGPPLVIGVATDRATEVRGEEPLEVVAASHAAALVDCLGGASGRPIEVVAVDLAGNPLDARDGVGQLLEASPVAIIGPRSAEVGLRLLEALGGQVPVLFPLTTEPALDDAERGGFLLGPDTTASARAAARFAGEQGWSTAATFSAAGPLVALGPTVFVEAFEAGGGISSHDLSYEVGGNDGFGDQISRLIGPLPQSQPEVIFTAMPVPQLVVLQKQLVDAEIDSALLTVDAREPVDAATVAGVLVVGRPPDDAVPEVGWFDQSYRTRSDARFEDPLAAARVADAILVVVAAIERAGSEPDSIGQALIDGLLLDGLSGTVGTGPLATDPLAIPVVELAGGRATLAATVTR